jgi:hypothetical protein
MGSSLNKCLMIFLLFLPLLAKLCNLTASNFFRPCTFLGVSFELQYLAVKPVIR